MYRGLEIALSVFFATLLGSAATGADFFYVSMSDINTVGKFDSLGNYYPSESLTSNISNPRGIAIDHQGNIFVAILHAA